MPDSISPAQCRGARGMAGLSQKELAAAARVSLSTVASFEQGTTVPMAKNMADIIAALESAGVEFVEENGGGPGVRLRKRESKGKR